MIKFLLEKEFKQLRRNSFLPRLIFLFPCMIMLLMPWAMNQEIRDVSLVVVDNDHSTTSRRLVDKVAASSYFHLASLVSSYAEGLHAVEAGEADVILEIPRHLERAMVNGEAGHVLVAVNAVNGTKGGLGGAYLTQMIRDFGVEWMQDSGTVLPQTSERYLPRVAVTTLNLFNPNLSYKLFMVPALMVMLLTLICGFLPAFNIVGEKEAGTIEQINVTPVGKFTFIFAKLLPYWIIGFVVLTLCFILAWALYGLVPVSHSLEGGFVGLLSVLGSFALIYFFVVLFVLGISGMGLVISNHSATLQQAMFVMWFCLLVLILMSGLFTPISSMPPWAQALAAVNPLKYLMQVMRMVYLRGSGVADLLPQLWALLTFATLFNVWAVLSYRKRS